MLYNVLGVVVANIEADSPEAAQRRLDKALDRAGFDSQDVAYFGFKAFEAEDGTEPGGLPK